MTHENQLLDKAINIYLTGLKGVESLISEPASEYNLSFEQFSILRKIINHPNIKLVDIAKQRQVTRSAVSRQLRILFQQKYVEQKTDPADRRRMFLVAVKKGRNTESEIWQRVNHRFVNWVQIYGEDRADQFLALFEDFNQQIIQGNIRKEE